MSCRRPWVALTLLPWLAAACGAGKPPLGRTADFLRRAKSVRLTVQPLVQGGQPRQIEILCPDRVRLVTASPAGTLEIVAVGDRAYSRQAGGPWGHVPLSSVNAPPVCQGSAWRPEAADLPRVFREMRRLPAIAGKARVVNGVPCQEWQVRRGRPAVNERQTTHVNLCLGIEDGRLLLMQVQDEAWVFTEWNGAVAIEQPRVAEDAPAPAPGPPPSPSTVSGRAGRPASR